MSEHLDIPLADRLVLQTAERASAQPGRRELVAELCVAIGFLITATILAMLLPWSVALSAPVCVLVVVTYLVASLVPFDVGTGFTDLSQLVLMPMLFLVPAPLVPLLVAAGLVLGRIPRFWRGDLHLTRSIMAIGDAWYSVGPAVVVALAGVSTLRPSDLWVGFAAYGALVVGDNVVTSVRDWAALGMPPRISASAARWVIAVDAMLTCAGMLVAFAVVGRPFLLLLLIPFFGVFVFFARDRRARIDGVAELSSAYRGTALLLGDLVEADHAYTGGHSRDVVALSTACAERLGLSDEQRRRTEFGALLHDIGKIAIPKAIIDKPGPLDDAEWELMKTHTIEGQLMLDRVGGVLGEAGVVVRASHEHYDGSGYPDGLIGEAIPIEARVVTCCDAFSAMTTDRSYRASIGLESAVAELRRCSGTQFDPVVVAVLVDLLQPLLSDLDAVAADAVQLARPVVLVDEVVGGPVVGVR